jgi:DMSO/TMAO reductase YedYZ molybdopterin-dependent catalytic subunit
MSSALARRQFMAGLAAAAFLKAETGEEVVPFLDATPFNPEKPTLPWGLTTPYITPDEHFFRVGHYGFPDVDDKTWELQIGGLAAKPRSFTLDELKRRPRREYVAALECSGNRPLGGLIANRRFAAVSIPRTSRAAWPWPTQ